MTQHQLARVILTPTDKRLQAALGNAEAFVRAEHRKGARRPQDCAETMATLQKHITQAMGEHVQLLHSQWKAKGRVPCGLRPQKMEHSTWAAYVAKAWVSRCLEDADR